VIVWHLAGSLFLFRWVFRDPAVDVRFLVAGALLPDLIDLSLGTIVMAGRYSTGELWMHTLLAPSLVVVVILLGTRRSALRRRWMALAVGMLLHLLLDGMWTDPAVLFWPFFGDFPPGPRPYWPGVWDRALSDPWRWAAEVVGVVYLVVLWRRHGLGRPGRWRELTRTGVLPESFES
jgi:hypothetical protein